MINAVHQEAAIPLTKWSDELYQLAKQPTQEMDNREELFFTLQCKQTTERMREAERDTIVTDTAIGITVAVAVCVYTIITDAASRVSKAIAIRADTLITNTSCRVSNAVCVQTACCSVTASH